MRLDKFLKVSRILKRRTVAKEIATGGRVTIGERVLKAGYEVKLGDQITMRFGDKFVTFRVLSTDERIARSTPSAMYEIVGEN